LVDLSVHGRAETQDGRANHGDASTAHFEYPQRIHFDSPRSKRAPTAQLPFLLIGVHPRSSAPKPFSAPIKKTLFETRIDLGYGFRLLHATNPIRRRPYRNA
jgi:hypothetical protein